MAKKERKNRIKVQDLPQNMKISEEEMKHVTGGLMRTGSRYSFDDPIIAFDDPIIAFETPVFFDDPIIAKPKLSRF